MITKFNNATKVADVTAEQYTPPATKIAVHGVNAVSARYIDVIRVGNVVTCGFEGLKSNGNFTIPQGYKTNMGTMPVGYRPATRYAAIVAVPTYGGNYNLTLTIHTDGSIASSAQSEIPADVFLSGSGSWVTNDPWPDNDTVITSTANEVADETTNDETTVDEEDK